MEEKPAERPSGVRHLHGIDLMRVLTVGGVIAVHVVSFTNRTDSAGAAGAELLLHTSRNVFFFLTALVLAYTYGRRQRWSLPRFWARRYWLLGTPYVIWTVLYWFADGNSPVPALRALGAIGHDLVTGEARYHLYFLLVTMQLYLVFPLLLWLVRVTRRYHWLLLAASVLVQLGITAAIHYDPLVPRPLSIWFNRPDALLPSYQLYVIAGMVAADRLGGLTEWIRRHRIAPIAFLAVATAAALGSYLFDIQRLLMPPLQAAEVFQPVLVIESLAVVFALFALGVAWSDLRRPAWLAGLVKDGAEASFGIYLVHPLVLQGVLALGVVTGVLGRVATASTRWVLALDLLLITPALMALTWIVVRALRGSPLSVPLTGRRKPVRARGAARWPRLSGMAGATGVAAILMGVVVTNMVANAVAAVGLESGRLPDPRQTATPPGLAQRVHPTSPPKPPTPPPPPGATSTIVTVQSGGLQRSYNVIQPLHPVSANIPAIVFLHGISAPLAGEEARDGLLPLADSGQATLVYPVGYGMSWNDGVCCGDAARDGIDDYSFLSTVISQTAAMPGVDPDRVFLVGYSNGGRMALAYACRYPAQLAGVVATTATLDVTCPSGSPVSELQIDGTNDVEAPYTQAVAASAAWRVRDGCPDTSVTHTAGTSRTERWSCRKDSVVMLDSYSSTGHDWPAGAGATPSAADVIWDFVKPLRRAG